MSDITDSRICISIAEPTVKKCVNSLGGLELAEIRLDKVKVNDSDIKKIFSQPVRLVATCRPGNLKDDSRKQILLKAIDAGAAYVDVEVDSNDSYKKEIMKTARKKGCTVIMSFHDYNRTPPKGELEQIVEWCFNSGADMAKIACKVKSDRDNARLLGLLDSERRIIVVGMGEKGIITRVVAPMLGSPFTFASLSKGKETAEGQVTARELRELLVLLK